MAVAQTGEISVRVSSKLTNSYDLDAVVSALDKTFSNAFGNGTGANQANNRWSDKRDLLTATNEDLDFAGSLSNALGAVVFTKIKGIIIYALSTNTGPISVTRPAANGVPFLLAAGDGLSALQPGGLFILTNPSDAGITVTAATGDLINVANATGATQSYQIIVFGVTA